MARQDDPKISLAKLSSTVRKQLLTRGLPKSVLTYKPFRLNERVSSFVSKVDGLKEKRIDKTTQIEKLLRLVEDPFLGPYVACISGTPYDIHAKLLGAYIMSRAVSLQLKKDELDKKHQRYLKDKGFPLWQTCTVGLIIRC